MTSRASIACTYCRRRKRRCDGDKPQCKTCRIKGRTCSYLEIPEDTNAGPTQLQRLEVVEALLKEHSEALERLKSAVVNGSPGGPDASVTSRPARSPLTTSPDALSQSLHPPGQLLAVPVFSRGDEEAGPPITIPLGHQTGTNSLFVLPQTRSLIGDYPEEFFLQIESNVPRSDWMHSMLSQIGQDMPDIDRATADPCFQSYLTLVYPMHPFLLKRHEAIALYEKKLELGFGSDVDSAIVLSFLAVGAKASDPVDEQGKNPMGDIFLQRSLCILYASWTTCFIGHTRTSEALVLCALCFTYSIDPLMAYKVIHMASTSVQQHLYRYKDLLSTHPEVQALTRLSWVCFALESDMLAEFHQPRSGIELVVDRMPFPNYGQNPSPENLYHLAEISARSLLNRIIHTLYFTDSLTIYAGRSASSHTSVLEPDASLLRVCNELDRQLEAWYEALPDVIKPDLEGKVDNNRQTKVLCLRYWSSKQAIYRAFVVVVTSRSAEPGGEHLTLPASVSDMCDICLSSCRMFLLSAAQLLWERTPYTYVAAQTCLSSILLISMAARSHLLQHLVPDVELFQQRTMELLGPWRESNASIRAGLEIVSLMMAKHRYAT